MPGHTGRCHVCPGMNPTKAEESFFLRTHGWSRVAPPDLQHRGVAQGGEEGHAGAAEAVAGQPQLEVAQGRAVGELRQGGQQGQRRAGSLSLTARQAVSDGL